MPHWPNGHSCPRRTAEDEHMTLISMPPASTRGAPFIGGAMPIAVSQD